MQTFFYENKLTESNHNYKNLLSSFPFHPQNWISLEKKKYFSLEIQLRVPLYTSKNCRIKYKNIKNCSSCEDPFIRLNSHFTREWEECMEAYWYQKSNFFIQFYYFSLVWNGMVNALWYHDNLVSFSNWEYNIIIDGRIKGRSGGKQKVKSFCLFGD